MRLSVRPIAVLHIADFENNVAVFLRNKGLGPMRILSLRATNDNSIAHDRIIAHMPTLPDRIRWSDFYGNIDGSVLEPGTEFGLLVLEGSPGDSAYREYRDAVRRRLSELTVRVEYENLYRQRMEPEELRLSWFGRHQRKHDN